MPFLDAEEQVLLVLSVALHQIQPSFFAEATCHFGRNLDYLMHAFSMILVSALVGSLEYRPIGLVLGVAPHQVQLSFSPEATCYFGRFLDYQMHAFSMVLAVVLAS